LDITTAKDKKNYIHILRNYCRIRCRLGRDRMVVGFTTTCVIGAYHH